MRQFCKRFAFNPAEDCSNTTRNFICLNACNARGTCIAGWCKCDPGYFGADCSLSLDAQGKPELLAGLGYKPRQKRPWIYVYELPPRFNTWHNLRTLDRPLHFLFWQRLLGAGARVADGDQADYFFIPMSQRGPSDSGELVAAIEYIRSHWPWWDRHQGARHIIIQAGDVGRMDMARAARDLTTNCTLLTHWGLTADVPSSGWKAAHRPGQDVVVPITISPLHPRGAVFAHSPLHPGAPPAAGVKDLQLLFAGRICGGREEPQTGTWPNCRPINSGYSQGVRQRVHYHHWNRTGYRVSVSNPKYGEDLARTRFCLAPTGGGHGHRQVLVAFSSCVPLLIGDHVLQPFEPELNWTSFSLSVPESDIPHLHEVLEGVGEDSYKSMQSALRCGAQHMAWAGFTGAFMADSGAYDAFETTLEILRMKLQHPEARPEDYMRLDSDFRAFAECRSQTPQQQGSGSGGGGAGSSNSTSSSSGPLCSLSTYDGQPPPCISCLQRHHAFVPGGAWCCGSPGNLAACSRPWQ